MSNLTLVLLCLALSCAIIAANMVRTRRATMRRRRAIFARLSEGSMRIRCVSRPTKSEVTYA